mmetsp:Transcript_46591/g.110789  ORF Transcript_46591/g.110789 Transcript_46591/m.110789 type:complete len:377 (-) Transcript_46591:141-1271(-)
MPSSGNRSLIVVVATAVIAVFSLHTVLAFLSPASTSEVTRSSGGPALRGGASALEASAAGSLGAGATAAVVMSALVWAGGVRAVSRVGRSAAMRSRAYLGTAVAAAGGSRRWASAWAPHASKSSHASVMLSGVQRRALADAEVASKIDDLIQEHPVILFTKSTCPFCAQAKQTLDEEGAKYFDFDLLDLPDEDVRAYQTRLMEMTGARTVPRVFIEGKCIGGCDDVVELSYSGELSKMLPAGSITKSKAGDAGGFKLEKSEDEWRKELTDVEYYILRQQGTEPPGSHEYDKFLPEKGHFACRGCKLPLYSADSKFKSSCGWPVFDKCYFSEDAGGCHVGTKPDFGSLEIVCNRCGSHLGHVFFDAFSASNPNGERH